MKMNAKKLTLALVALLLALTCVFVACKKEPEKPVDDKPADQPTNTTPDPVDLTKVAEDFKADYEANYLSLYTDDVVTALESLKAEAILKITSAETLDAAKKLAANYIAELKAARTFVDEVKDLIAKIAVDGSLKHDDPAKGVALADEANVELLAYYNGRIEDKFVTAAGAQVAVIDDYKANTWETVKAIVARLRTLKVAKLAADNENGLNAKIAAVFEKADNAVAYSLDGEFEGDEDKLTLKDYEDLLVLQAEIETFAELNELVEGTEAYAEILDKPTLDQADALFAEKTANHKQINRARRVIESAKALAAAARDAARYFEDAEDEDKLVWVNGQDYATESEVNANQPIYFISMSVFEAAESTNLPDEDIANPIKVTALWGEEGWLEPVSKWVDKADVYDDLTTAYAELNTLKVIEVVISGDSATRNPFMIQIPNSEWLRNYILDAELQAKAEDAVAAATAWAELLDQQGNEDLQESIANKFFYGIIKTIVADYNESLAGAVEDYRAFAEALVLKNYVEEYPVKGTSYNEYVLTTDTTSGEWKDDLLDEIARLIRSAKTNYATTDTAFIAGLFNYLLKDVYPFTADYGTSEEFGNVNLYKDNDTFTPSVSYATYIYRWLVDSLNRTEKVEVTPENTDVIATVLAGVDADFFLENLNVNFYELAKDLIAWVDTYIEEIPETEFDLAPFKTVQSDKICAEDDAVEFGDVKFTFADSKLEEVAIPQVTVLNGEAVVAEPTEALDITVYSDYHVALMAIAEHEKQVKLLAEALVSLRSTVKALFQPGAADAIDDAIAEFEATSGRYTADVVIAHADEAEPVILDLCGYEWDLDEFTYADYEETLDAAKALQDRVLFGDEQEEIDPLYPHAEWDNALAALKAALDAANEALGNHNAKLDAFDEVLADARAYLAYCEAGYKVGWHTEEDECSLIDQETYDAAKTRVEVLETWRNMFLDASKFIVENDARMAALVTPNVPRDPAAIDFEENLAEVLAAYIGNANDNASLIEYMVAILTDADETVEYKVEDGVVVIMVPANLDKIALEKAVAAAKADFEEARAAFVASFKLDGKKSYADIATLIDLIADLEDFLIDLDDIDESIAGEYYYLNLSVTNEYTENAIDLFSQIFNEMIMAKYYRSVLLVVDYATEKAEAAEADEVIGVDDIDELLEYVETAWIEYAKATIADAVTSKLTLADFRDGDTAVLNAWRTLAVNYEWAVNAINYFFEINDVDVETYGATYEELLFEEGNDVAGFQFDTDDIPGYLITAGQNPVED